MPESNPFALKLLEEKAVFRTKLYLIQKCLLAMTLYLKALKIVDSDVNMIFFY